MRIGIGYDVHAFCDGRPLILGGQTIPYTRGLMGHSDADVLTHAICDALLGALALGNIGTFFPDSDARYSGISSLILLSKTVEMIRAEGYEIGNVDATVVAQAPKLNPFILAMRETLSQTMGVSISDVSVKATTSENMGFIGREEGVAVHAVALLRPR